MEYLLCVQLKAYYCPGQMSGSRILETLENVTGLSWHFANQSVSRAHPVLARVLALTWRLPGNRLSYRNSHSFFQADAHLISDPELSVTRDVTSLRPHRNNLKHGVKSSWGN